MFDEKNITESNEQNVKENLTTPERKTPEEEKQELNSYANKGKEYLRDIGIELLSDEEKAKMSFENLTSYSLQMKDKILDIQNNLPPKDRETSESIFNEAYSDLDLTSKKYCALREKYDI